MASNLTTAGATRVISGGALTTVCTHIALFTASPGAAGSLTNELANSNGYSRQAITWTSSGDADEENSATITFTASGGDWSAATHYGLVSSGTHGAGTMYVTGALSTSRTVADGGSLSIAAGDLTMTGVVVT